MGKSILPIFKSALDLASYVESVVRSFDRYHKYTIGTDMRKIAQEMLFVVNRAGLTKDRTGLLVKLVDMCEDFKMLLQIAKEIKAFKSFKHFEHSSKLAVEICRQAQGWLAASKRGGGGVRLSAA